MLRTSVILFASFGLLAGCASSSATTNTNPPGDAGKVNYDVGQPSGGAGGDAGAGDGGAAEDPSNPAIKGRDSTTTRGAAVKPRVVKKVATTKPPKAEEPAPEPGKTPPKRKGRVDPNGLLVEAFTIATGTDKLPDFAAIGAPKSLFISGPVDGTEATPLVGLPKGAAAPVALRFTGSLNVLEAAEYKFCVTSQDGSALLLEDTPIVENDGVKKDGPAELCEVVGLDPGEYSLELRSFHSTGPIVVRFTWAKGKEGTAEVVPLRNLFKPQGADDRVKAGK